MSAPITPPAAATRLGAGELLVFLTLTTACIVSQQPWMFACGALLCAAFALRELAPMSWSRSTVAKSGLFSLLFVPAFLKPELGVTPGLYAFTTLAILLAAWALASYPPDRLDKAFQGLYVLCASAIVAGLIWYRHEHEPMALLLPDTSVNGIPSYMLVVQLGRSLSFYANRGRLPYLSPLITGWIAFVGVGRGSLIVAGLLIAATLVFNMAACRRASGSWIARISPILLLSLMLSIGPAFYEWIALNTKLATGLIDTHRADILRDYWYKLDGWSAVVGRDYSGTLIKDRYNGNPHVAYLRTHAFFGLPLTLLALLSPLAVAFAPVPWLHKRVYMIFCGLLVMRAMTEPILFPTLFDLIYFACLMLPFRRDTISSLRAPAGLPLAAPRPSPAPIEWQNPRNPR